MRHPVGVDDGFTPYPTQELSPSNQQTQINTITQRALKLGIDEVCMCHYVYGVCHYVYGVCHCVYGVCHYVYGVCCYVYGVAYLSICIHKGNHTVT